jgi:hypothetical protein
VLITRRSLPSPDAVVVDQDEGKILLAARRSPAARRTFARFGFLQPSASLTPWKSGH